MIPVSPYRYQDHEFFLGKLIKKITNAVTKPTLNKVNESLAKIGNTSLQDSATKIQQGIVEDSPKGAVKSLVIAGTVITAGLLAPAAGAGGLTASKILEGASFVAPLLKGQKPEDSLQTYQVQVAPAVDDEAEQKKKFLFIFGSIIVFVVVALLMIRA
jgi:hypothetical protein